MEGPTAYRGTRFCIEYAVRANGRCPAREFHESLPTPDQAKILALLVRMGDHGQIFNKEKFKKIEGTRLYEFKSFQVRIICSFQPKRRLVLLHGVIKKKDRYDRSDIETAERILAEHEGRGEQ
jgi:mRNA-degrading endonuclease RelE of RelBE toxin-antitoxin system